MKKNNSITEIAGILKISRNTVSKVINGKPGVSEKTQIAILDFININSERINSLSILNKSTTPKGNIIFSYFFENTEYLNNIIVGAESILKEYGYSMLLNIVQVSNENDILLPPSLYSDSVKGIISFNIFNEAYWDQIISSNIPSVFIDTFYKPYLYVGKADIVATENSHAIHEIMNILIKKGKNNWGFVGNPNYCFSHNERWKAFKDSLEENSLCLKESNCVYDSLDSLANYESVLLLKERIKNMEQTPDAFICVNDMNAIILTKVLQELNLNIPDDVAIVGFGNVSEAVRHSPPITTIDSDCKYLGQIAVKLILERIQNPNKHFEFVQYDTKLILRESTGHSSL